MKYVTVKYNTNDKEVNEQLRVYDAKCVNQTIIEDIEDFNNRDILVYSHTVRASTRDEIIEMFEDEMYDKDDLIYIICKILNV